MITSGVKFINFKKKNNKNVLKKIYKLLEENNSIIRSLSKNYKDDFIKKNLNKFKKSPNFRLIGIGGSSLGAKSIYYFLKHKIRKNFYFLDNLQANKIKIKKKITNLIISKSGNTIETIVNLNIFVKKGEKNLFITEKKENYLYLLAQKMKAEIIHHNNYIGGRYSVLSEAGMVPAELMGLNSKNFRQYNALIKNKKFLNSLINNVASILFFIKKKKFNSIIINYDEKSENFFKWYQQLVAESLGKDKIGLLPIVSNMPKDNHSVMQLYLDGFENNFYTFFNVHEKKSEIINNKKLLKSHYFLKNKNISNIIGAQKKATEKVFTKKIFHFEVLKL